MTSTDHDPTDIVDHGHVLVGLVALLRWPIAVIVLALLFRTPLDALFAAVVQKIAH